MLVLSRKRGESILIGNDITVTVLEVRGDRVKLGFTAPVDVPIHRTEVQQSIEHRSSELDVCDGVPLAMQIELACSELQGASV
jgi:carbon storage regulator